MPQPFLLTSFPRAILHIDGDAFFAACEQALKPELKGKPVITGKERGIAASLSYEAKARGVTRGMPYHEIRAICPDAVFVPSDYETYSIFSQRFFSIVRRYSGTVEEYSIDECFADLTGMRRPLHGSYRQILERLQDDLTRELGVSFSLGLAPSKVLAKTASKWNKPHGITLIPGRLIHTFLSDLPVTSLWGVGTQTGAYLAGLGIHTALQLAQKPYEWVCARLTKPHQELWCELRGQSVLPVTDGAARAKQSISKTKTFSPPSADRALVFGQLCRNLENACIKARRLGLNTREITFILRRKNYEHNVLTVMLTAASAHPPEMLSAARSAFERLFVPRILYRATGVVLHNLQNARAVQMSLFSDTARHEKIVRLFQSVDELDRRFGKHTVFLGAACTLAQEPKIKNSRHERTSRKQTLFRGETARKRIAIPLLTRAALKKG